MKSPSETHSMHNVLQQRGHVAQSIAYACVCMYKYVYIHSVIFTKQYIYTYIHIMIHTYTALQDQYFWPQREHVAQKIVCVRVLVRVYECIWGEIIHKAEQKISVTCPDRRVHGKRDLYVGKETYI